MMRLFIAANIPPGIRDSIYGDAAAIRAASTAIRWVSATALHITLKFLGQQDDRLVDEFRSALESVARRHQPFSVETTEIGAFPNFRRPRVVWVGMTEAKSFQALARDIDQALGRVGIAPETRAFQAHLTLGRAKGEMRPPEAAALAEAATAPRPSRSFVVETVDLMRSELGPGGSRYSVMASVPLHARGT